MTNTSHSIADVERDTGLSKDTLRVWERRYGFPQPLRDAASERRYDDDQLQRLRHIRRLLDAGHRPGRVVPLPMEALLALQPAALDTQSKAQRIQKPKSVTGDIAMDGLPESPPLTQWSALLLQHDAPGLRAALIAYAERRGWMSLLSDGIAVMNTRVGQDWIAGRLAVFEEHLYSEVVQGVLREAIAQERDRDRQRLKPPRVLLTTVPGEVHGLGVLMAECVMTLQGCDVVSLGLQMPLNDLPAAAAACRADVVALGFSNARPPREARAALTQARALLPAPLDIWTGGHCPALERPPRSSAPWAGHAHMGSLSALVEAVQRWRAERETPTPLP